MDLNKSAEGWSKVLVMLEEVRVDPKKLRKMEERLSRTIVDLEELINREKFPDTPSSYEQLSLAIELQSTLEDLREKAEELEQLEKKLQSFCKGEDG